MNDFLDPERNDNELDKPVPDFAPQPDNPNLTSEFGDRKQVSGSHHPQRSASPERVPHYSHGSPAYQRRDSSVLNSIFWIMCCGAFIVGLWQLGPMIAERYQYAMSRGKLKAEYENASQLLKSDPLTNVSFSSQLVAQKIRPSVVSINTIKGMGRYVGAGQGSGVIIDESGYVVTNHHVVNNALVAGVPNAITVRLADNFEYPAQLIGSDEESDLAVLKIDAPNLIPANWGDSDSLSVGSMVWAVGSPFGFDQTVTQGIVSGKNRVTETVEGRTQSLNRDLLQTDAAVNPGNSGGPLVDTQGNVVGINTSIIGETYRGISFAVPSVVAKYVVQQLIQDGSVHRGYFGFQPRAVKKSDFQHLALPDMKGALVNHVEPDTPAQKAGLRPQDIIRTWNGKPVENYHQVFNLIGITPPNSIVKVEVFREGQLEDMMVRVTERPNLPEPPQGK
ncbi:MAG: trypsin-like peptidase domain-containing protein [Pirellulaceae bacterium]